MGVKGGIPDMDVSTTVSPVAVVADSSQQQLPGIKGHVGTIAPAGFNFTAVLNPQQRVLVDKVILQALNGPTRVDIQYTTGFTTIFTNVNGTAAFIDGRANANIDPLSGLVPNASTAFAGPPAGIDLAIVDLQNGEIITVEFPTPIVVGIDDEGQFRNALTIFAATLGSGLRVNLEYRFLAAGISANRIPSPL